MAGKIEDAKNAEIKGIEGSADGSDPQRDRLAMAERLISMKGDN